MKKNFEKRDFDRNSDRIGFRDPDSADRWKSKSLEWKQSAAAASAATFLRRKKILLLLCFVPKLVPVKADSIKTVTNIGITRAVWVVELQVTVCNSLE